MKAAIMHAPYDMRIGPWDEPEPGAGEVLVETAAAGICAGDMYFYLGKNPYAVYPQICGHEVSGTIRKIGRGVNGFEVGTPVVVEPFLGCGKCYPCRIGRSNCCTNLKIIGVHLPGGYAEYLAAPAAKVHAVPEGLSLIDASFTEPAAVGVQACRRGAVGSEDLVLVLGCGPIGLILIEVARARGAAVLASDTNHERLELAERFGADPVPADPDLVRRIVERTDGEGAPVVIEATGNTAAMEQTAQLVASGGRIIIVGLVKQGVGVAFPGLDFTRKEMTIIGSRASVGCFPEALRLLAEGSISPIRLSSQYNLWDAPKVFAELAVNPVVKGVLVRT